MAMRKFLTGLVLIPLGLLFIDFAVANRHLVTVSFDPFGSGDTAFDLPPVPLFAIIIASIIVGVVAGGLATWFRQGRWRRAARQHEADARQVRAQLAELRTGATSSPSGYQPQRLPAPLQAGPYGAAGRDKQGATL
jgi:uncharacterized integral membrane protein